MCGKTRVIEPPIVDAAARPISALQAASVLVQSSQRYVLSIQGPAARSIPFSKPS